MFEKIICAAISSFLTSNNLISPQQHETKILDDGKSVDVAYFDYAKAFDKVSHRLLLIKLKAIDGKTLAWIEAWLKDRMQSVVVGDAKSPWLEVLSGTTQGTVLGFLLFLIFINDLPEGCNPGLPYNVNGTEIEAGSVEKFIGFWISDNLLTSTHVHKARGKALGEIARIRRNFSVLPLM